MCAEIAVFVLNLSDIIFCERCPIRATYLRRCIAVLRIRRCLHWLSSAISLRVM